MRIGYGVLVIYNHPIEKSSSYATFKDQLSILVADNSTNEEIRKRNQNQVEKDGNVYLDMKGNQGLSKAYNQAISWIQQKEQKSCFVLIMDDDTIFGNDFLQKATQEMNSKQADAYVPIVKAEKQILSPCMIHRGRVKAIHDLSSITRENITAINSGMIVSLNVYQKIRYNENLFLEYIDHDFIRQLKQYKYSIHVLQQEIQQNFSVFENDKASAKTRFSILKKDLHVFYGKSLSQHFLYKSILWKRKLRAVIQYKDLSIVWKW
ncbi:glycosyltransferase [Faecalicoccus pleomorphus]|uniref:glycosyltransferase n=1 Tax=Faecalicoccus pleomorphus TaxID=1323 RepID=UPI0019619A04|nr:glycosyltransferase [Faecalicoccus pleomorphus]MBM6677877.1 glycosyltransferase [Faecalicoccus pleomorphus]